MAKKTVNTTTQETNVQETATVQPTVDTTVATPAPVKETAHSVLKKLVAEEAKFGMLSAPLQADIKEAVRKGGVSKALFESLRARIETEANALTEKHAKAAAFKPKSKTAEAPAPAPAEEPKKSKLKANTKADKKAPEPKKPAEVVEAEPATHAADLPPCVKLFPESIDHPELGKLVACPSMTYDEFKATMNAEPAEGEEPQRLFIATYWSPAMLKKFKYGEHFSVTAPKSFPSNLDLLSALTVCENVDRVWAMSVYTEAMVRLDSEDFERMSDKDASGEFTVRVSGGMEWEIYTPAK